MFKAIFSLANILSSLGLTLKSQQTFQLTNSEQFQIENIATAAYCSQNDILIFTWIHEKGLDYMFTPFINEIAVELLNLSNNEVCSNSLFIVSEDTEEFSFSTSVLTSPSIAVSDMTKTFMILWGVNSTTVFGALYSINEDCRVSVIRPPYNITSVILDTQDNPQINPLITTLQDIFVIVFEEKNYLVGILLNSTDGSQIRQFPFLIAQDDFHSNPSCYTTCLASLNAYDSFVVGWMTQTTAGNSITSKAFVAGFNISSMSFLGDSPILAFEQTYNADAIYGGEVGNEISIAVASQTNSFMLSIVSYFREYTHFDLDPYSFQSISYGVIGKIYNERIHINSESLFSQNLTLSPSVAALGELFLVVSLFNWTSTLNGYLYNSSSGDLVTNTIFQGEFNNTQQLGMSIGFGTSQVEVFSFDNQEKIGLSWTGQKILTQDNFATIFQISQSECESNLDCYQSESRYCDQILSTCVQCLTNQECPNYQPSCSEQFRCFKCNSDADCSISKFGNICYQGICLECLSANDCSSSNPVCLNNVCQPSQASLSCQENSECIGRGSLKVCHKSICYECLTDNDCLQGEICDEGLSCVPILNATSSHSSQLIPYIVPLVIGAILIISCVFFIRRIRDLRKDRRHASYALDILQENHNHHLHQVQPQHILQRSRSSNNLSENIPVNVSNVRISEPIIELRPNHNEDDNRRDCVICLEKESLWAPIPCGHICLCEECKEQIRNTTRLCPICRKESASMIRVYF